MAPNMGGYDVLALYSEAIQKMNENPGVPPLFRDIFKNAYLPYRDPETLRGFLKEIDLFVKDFKGNDPKFVCLLLESVDLKSLGERTAAVPSLDRKNAHRLKVYLPTLPEQHTIVAQIEEEQRLVNATKELIRIFENKIKSTINRIWAR